MCFTEQCPDSWQGSPVRAIQCEEDENEVRGVRAYQVTRGEKPFNWVVWGGIFVLIAAAELKDSICDTRVATSAYLVAIYSPATFTSNTTVPSGSEAKIQSTSRSYGPESRSVTKGRMTVLSRPYLT